MTDTLADPIFLKALRDKAESLGISDLSSSSIDLSEASEHFLAWTAKHFHADLDYMTKHGEKRYRPELLVEGTVSIITAKLNYFNPDFPAKTRLTEPSEGYVSMYALGRDYHKVLRKQLNDLGKWMQEAIPDLQFRAFVDSAPVLERALSHQSGLGFFGKNTMIIHPKAGSYFFLGEIYIDRAIDISSEPIINHCGGCTRCLKACPTDAIVEPFQIDAGKCISYLTIESFGPIPVEFRKPMGNRIFGCDDCQIVCPWNRFSTRHVIEDFLPRHKLDSSSLLELFNWTEAEFLKKTEGSPIRRLGYDRWLRNIAIGIGNDQYRTENIDALREKEDYPDPAVQEHVAWALSEQLAKKAAQMP